MSDDLSSKAREPGQKVFLRPKPDGNTDPAGEAGWYLERERIRRGLSLQAASQATGVHQHHLRAIEMGMLENLPERDEALRMIAAYAQFLGFEPGPLVEHFASHVPMPRQRANEGGQNRSRTPAAFSSARIMNFPLLERLRAMSRTPGGLSASVLALVLLFGGITWSLWPSGTPEKDEPATQVAQTNSATGKSGASETQKLARSDKANARREVRATAEVREEALPDVAPEEALAENDPIGALIARTMQDPALAAPGKEKAEERARSAPHVKASGPQSTAPAASGEKTLAASEKVLPAPLRVDGSGTPVMTRAPQPRAQAPAPDNGPALHENITRPVNEVPAKGLALRATNMIWVRLEDDKGVSWYSGFLRPGQVLKLPDDRMLRLTAGDVHRLEWYVNGRRMGRLGQRGSDFISEPLGRFYRQGGLKPPGANKAG